MSDVIIPNKVSAEKVTTAIERMTPEQAARAAAVLGGGEGGPSSPATPSTPGIVKMLSAPGIAPADTAVRGDDYRLNRTLGGLHFAGGQTYGFAKLPVSQFGQPDLAVLLRVRRTATTGQRQSILSSYDDDLSLEISTSDDGRVRVGTATPVDLITTAAGVLPLDEEVALLYVRANSVGTLYANGVSVGSAADGAGYYGAMTLGNGYAQNTPFGGIVHECRIYNRALTLAEVGAISAGKPVEALAYPAGFGGNTAATNGRLGFNNATGYSSIDGLVGSSPPPSITGTFPAFSGATFTPEFLPRQGQRVRVRFSVSGYTGNIPGWVGLFSESSPFEIGLPSGLSFTGDGTYEYVATVSTLTAGMTFRIAVFNPEASGSWSGTVAILAIDYLGEKASYAPGDVVRSGRWRDGSGNNLDLWPQGRVTALNPAESYSRVFPGSLSAILPGLNAGGFNEITPLVSGTTPESGEAIRSVRLGDTYHVAFDSPPPAGVSIRAATIAPSDGQLPVLLTSLDSDPQTLAGVSVTVTHIVK